MNNIITDTGACIQLWNVHFDNDEFSYTYLSRSQAIQAVEAFAELQISDNIGNKNDIIVSVVNGVKDELDKNDSDAMCIVTIDEAKIHLKRITIDDYNPIVKALMTAIPQVDIDTQRMINNLMVVK